MQVAPVKIICIVLAFFYFCFGLVSSVFAQTYVFESGGNNSFANAQVIASPEKIQYIYGVISKGDETIDYYQLPFSSYTENVQFTLLVNEDQKQANFRPAMIVSDPNSSRLLGVAPFGFPPQMGGRIFNWPHTEAVAEKDGNYLEKLFAGSTTSKNVSPNTYVVAVFDPDRQGGRYVLKIGAELPESSWQDKLQLVWSFIRVKLKLY